MNKDIEIKNFQQAVAQSPYLGHALMRNVDIDSFPGAMRVRSKMLSMPILVTSRTFTADAGTDICTASATLVTTAMSDAGNNFQSAAVQFTTTGTLPAGLSLSTTYFISYITDTTFKVSTNWNNSQTGVYIDITGAGSGTHTISPIQFGTVYQQGLVRDKRNGRYFAQDSNGRVWFSTNGTTFFLLDGNSLTGAFGNGLALFRTSDGSATYLFVFRSASIDVINVFADSNVATPVWTTNWKSLNSGAGTGNRHQALVGQDNIIYFTDDRFVGSIQEKPGFVFDPATAGTYTFNSQALTLPQNELAYCLEEINTYLLTGSTTSNSIYPWDRVSVSYTIPLRVPEKGTYEMKNIGQKVVILAGTKGNIYSTQGTYVTLLCEIPTYLTNNSTSLGSNIITWGGLAYRSGNVVLGVNMVFNSAASGLYVLYDDGRIVQDNTPSAGATSATAIYADAEVGYVIGYNGGADYNTTTRPAAGTFAAVYQSAMYAVGNKTQKAKFSKLEIQTGRNQGGQVRVSYRTDLSAAFTAVTTFTSTAQSYTTDSGLTDLENIQFQLEFDSNTEIHKFSAII